jgi:predicted transcriptional regulator
MEDLRFIGERRRKLGLTQHALAKLSGVSQSLIAKIESGKVDAAYSKVKGIEDALERAAAGKEKKACDMMHAGVSSVEPSDSLHSAATAMSKKGISQMPVVDKGTVVGSVSEASIIANFSSGKKMAAMRVCDVMEEAFPSALPSTPISAIAALLRHHPAVLVMDKGRVAGIITKADLLRSI